MVKFNLRYAICNFQKSAMALERHFARFKFFHEFSKINECLYNVFSIVARDCKLLVNQNNEKNYKSVLNVLKSACTKKLRSSVRLKKSKNNKSRQHNKNNKQQKVFKIALKMMSLLKLKQNMEIIQHINQKHFKICFKLHKTLMEIKQVN